MTSRLQNYTGLGGWEAGEGGNRLLSSLLFPIFLLEPLTLITSGSCRPCVVPIISLPATISEHPTPICGKKQPSPHPSLQQVLHSGNPNSFVAFPLTPTMNLTGPQAASWLLLWLCPLPGMPPALVALTHILPGLAQTSRNPQPGPPYLPGSSCTTSGLPWEVLGNSGQENVCLHGGRFSPKKKVLKPPPGATGPQGQSWERVGRGVRAQRDDGTGGKARH